MGGTVGKITACLGNTWYATVNTRYTRINGLGDNHHENNLGMILRQERLRATGARDAGSALVYQ